MVSAYSVAQQLNSGWDFLLDCDATINFCRAKAGLITLGHNSSLGVQWCITTISVGSEIMGGSSETKQTYQQSYDAVLCAAHLIFKLPVCCIEDCITCVAVRLSLSR